jgi:hypothetical protein
MTARILAAADAYQAMTQEPPHRPALSAAVAEEQPSAEAHQGRLDGEVVRAVLKAAGHRPVRGHGAWYTFDPTGHRSQPDVLNVTVDRRRQEAATFADEADDPVR